MDHLRLANSEEFVPLVRGYVRFETPLHGHLKEIANSNSTLPWPGFHAPYRSRRQPGKTLLTTALRLRHLERGQGDREERGHLTDQFGCLLTHLPHLQYR